MLLYLLTLLDDPSDEPLVREMYNLYNVKLCKYAIALLHNKHDAEDVVQDAWVRMILNFTIPKKCFFESHKSFFHYSTTVVKNLSLDEIKKHKRVTEFPEDWDVPAPDSTEAHSDHDMLVSMIESMPRSMYVVLKLHIDGFSFKEIGKSLGCKEDAARKRYNKALDAFKKRTGDAGY